MKRTLSVFLLVLASVASYGASCGSRPPKPTPTPTPPIPTPPPASETVTAPPVAPIGLELLLRNDGTGKWSRGGAPHQMRMAIPCWTDDPQERLFVQESPGAEPKQIPYLWPLVSPEWMKYTGGRAWNAGEIRPFFKDACCGLEGIGGPYLYPSGEWNPEFWKVYHRTLWSSTAQKWNILVDVADGWIAKHCNFGETKLCPFISAEDSKNFFAVPLNSSLKAWVAKLVSETDNYGGVVFQISNESEIARFPDPSIPSWSLEWERAMFAEIRANEKNVVHMIATNTRDYNGPYDFFTDHNIQMISGPMSGRPFVVNEYNPHLPPARFRAFHCAAISSGQTFAYWRSDGTLDDQTGSINVDCAAPTTCPAPVPDRSKLSFSIKCTGNGICDATPIVTKDCGYCASVGMGTSPGGEIRCACPARNECPGTPGYEGMCEDRVRCEQYLMSVPGKNVLAPVWIVDVGEVVLVDEYGFRARCNGCTVLQACNADQSVCVKAPL